MSSDSDYVPRMTYYCVDRGYSTDGIWVDSNGYTFSSWDFS
ncbi:MAG: hypothetical protein ACOC56_04920 [Atribacterota bacterium]